MKIMNQMLTTKRSVAARYIFCTYALAIVLGLCQLAATADNMPANQGGKWALSDALPEPRQEASAVALGNMIYVIGGYGAEGVPSMVVHVYETDAKKWKQVAPIPDGLHHIGVAAVDRKIYVVGGFAKTFRDRVPVDSTWQYDSATDRWERRAPLPTPRGALAVAVLDGKIYAMGGEHFSAPGAKDKYEPVADVAAYDPKTDKWEVLPPMRQKRDHLVAGAISGRIYAVSGRERPNYMLRDTEEYNPSTRKWTDRAPMPSGRSGGAGAAVKNRLYVFGGEGNDDSPLGTFNQ